MRDRSPRTMHYPLGEHSAVRQYRACSPSKTNCKSPSAGQEQSNHGIRTEKSSSCLLGATWPCNGLLVEVPYARAGLQEKNLSSATTRDERRSVY